MNNKLDDEIVQVLLDYDAIKITTNEAMKQIKSLCFAHERKRIREEVEKRIHVVVREFIINDVKHSYHIPHMVDSRELKEILND